MVENQTDPHYLKGLLEDDIGTGVFLVPNPKSGIVGDATRILVADITYDECLRRGVFTMAFKWVPETVMTYEQMQEPISCKTQKE